MDIILMEAPVRNAI